MRKKKILKFICIFTVLIVAFSAFFLVSAVVEFNIPMPIGQPTVTNTLSYLEVTIQDSNNTWVNRGYTFFISHESVDSSGTLPVYVSFYQDTQRRIMKIYNNSNSPVVVYGIDNNGSVYNFQTIYNNGDFVEFRFPYNFISAKPYGHVEIRDMTGWNPGTVVFSYGSDVTSISLLTQILNALNSQSGTAGSIVGAIEGSTNDIIANNNANSLEFWNKLEEQENKHHEELMNGWTPNKQIDTTVTDDYGAADQEIQNATSEGRSQAVGLFNSFGSLFQPDNHLYKGLLSVSAIFTEFLKIDWVSSILNFSLAIGVFAFVIGTGSSVARWAHERSDERRSVKSEDSGG